MSGPDGSDEYYRAIEEEFNRLRQAPMLLSPRDWALIGEWREAGVPLRVVLQGIANVFESYQRRAPGARRINSLSYCRQEVLSLHEIYLGLRGADAGRPAIPAGESTTNKAVLRHLTRLARRVREAMTVASEEHHDDIVQALARIPPELKRMRSDFKAATLDPQQLEQQLRQLDEELLESARAALSPEQLARLEGEAESLLAGRRARMTAEAYAATRRSHLARQVRHVHHIPRLTLFD